MRARGVVYEINRIGGKPNTDSGSAPFVPGSKRKDGSEGPNGAGRMMYALARLRASDEAHSEALARDPRCYVADPDEATERPCGARREP